MQEKIKIITIGEYKDSIVNDYFKDNENIEFLELGLDENIEKFKNSLSNLDVVFLRSNEDNFEKLLEMGKLLKEKEIITVTILEEKFVTENKEILENNINAIFPVSKRSDIENLLLEVIKLINNAIFSDSFMILNFEDVKNILKDLGIAIFGTLNLNEKVLEKEIISNINYPFYNKAIKGSKLILIHFTTLQNASIYEDQLITNILKNESGKNIEDIMFSMRIDNNLKNRIECNFIAGKF